MRWHKPSVCRYIVLVRSIVLITDYEAFVPRLNKRTCRQVVFGWFVLALPRGEQCHLCCIHVDRALENER